MNPLTQKAQPKGWLDSETVNVVLSILCGIALGVMLGYSIAIR